uniref:Uncharacterized protein n=1 Tax=Triticum urartu TaxID=4572 RepID=A0A8R7PM76_TRIUA
MCSDALGGRLHRGQCSGVVVVWRPGLDAPVSSASDMGGSDQEPKDADSLEYSDQQTRLCIPIIETRRVFPFLTSIGRRSRLLSHLRRMLLGTRSMSLSMKTRMLTGCSLAIFLRIQQVFPKLCHKDEEC